jgi:hypothetical protein
MPGKTQNRHGENRGEPNRDKIALTILEDKVRELI